MSTGQLNVHTSVKDFFDFDHIKSSTPAQLQQMLSGYFSENEASLVPSFWNKLFSATYTMNDKFGETPLKLGDHHLIYQSQVLHQYQAGVLLCNLEDPKYTAALDQQFKWLNSQANPTHILLAERMSHEGNHIRATELFNQVSPQHVKFTEKQKILHVHSAIELGHYADAVRLAGSIDASNEKVPLKKIFAESMFKLGDHFASQLGRKRDILSKCTFGLLPSSTDKAQQADKFYRIGLAAADSIDSLRVAHQRVLSQRFDLLTKYRLSVSSSSASSSSSQPSNNLLAQIYEQLAEMQRLNPLDDLDSLQSRQRIQTFTNLMFKFCKENKPEDCLDPIEKALQFIGDVKAKLQIKFETVNETWYRSVTKPVEIQPAIKNLLKEQNAFAFDVGASLHFLKGEIIRMTAGDTEEVLNEYKLAANLAPSNPFGADALFMIDEQEDLTEIANDIESYRSIAIEWGSEELKAFVRSRMTVA